ncbi:dual specificity protein phosphatase 22 [Tachyglossus aculeatus]|uniref:dual specificity protein phosphatase 22 n=1 Tax=Tachyglossus aculeatus TaxID=9261 RepID=UPI0018F6B36A|nr:dual specificity protein phosphatase 22 [Tachyglossus aculeatus]
MPEVAAKELLVKVRERAGDGEEEKQRCLVGNGNRTSGVTATISSSATKGMAVTTGFLFYSLKMDATAKPGKPWTRHFKENIKFIHVCRLRGESCLVHCLAGVSRSVTLVVAYVMTVNDFGWKDGLHTVWAGRSCATLNVGFPKQLQEFEKNEVQQFQQWLKEAYGESPLRDAEQAISILGKYREQVHAESQQNASRWRWSSFSTPPSLAYGNYKMET